MPIIDLYEAGNSRKQLAHFATLCSLAAADGEINEEEKAILDRFAIKLDISEAEYKEIMKKENKYPIETSASEEKRMKRLYDFFQIIFSDRDVDNTQLRMVEKYAIGLGFPVAKSEAIIEKSIKIFTGQIAFEDYLYLMDK